MNCRKTVQTYECKVGENREKNENSKAELITSSNAITLNFQYSEKLKQKL